MIDAFERAMKMSMRTAEDTKDALSRMSTRVLQNQVCVQNTVPAP